MGLQEYRRKRDFRKTPEPAGRESKRGRARGGRFVVQKHEARGLHYDFRLELGGVLKSWAVPKGPSLDPEERRLAVHVEDHPVEYGDFEGVIPRGEYGAGPVLLWDRGEWIPEGDAERGYRRGKLKFRLAGEKLRGGWVLVRTGGRDGDGKDWLLIKESDEEARPGRGGELLERRPESVATDRDLDEVARQRDRLWTAAEGEVAVAEATGPDASALPGARKAPLPRRFAPQLAALVKAPPAGDGWLHEIKFDGYRLGCRLNESRARLWSRNGQDWTADLPRLVGAATRLPARSALLDGELVVVEPSGVTSFQALQNVMGRGRDDRIVYYAFDLLYLDGHDLTGVALERRKQVLRELLAAASRAHGELEPIRYSDHVVGRGGEVYAEACELGAEGIISKRRDRPYRAGRTRDWLKIKCWLQRDFVVGGFTEPSGSRAGFGALLVGVYDEKGDLRYSGRVGTGYTEQTLRELRRLLEASERPAPPFVDPPSGRDARGVRWTEPELVAAVAFNGWTDDGVLRQPAFKGLRVDVDPREVRREEAAPTPGRADRVQAPRPRAPRAGQRPEVAGVRLTTPDRILYPESGVTKLELVSYYEQVAEHMLPHVAGRLLTLYRCPEGHAAECFFQKHADPSFPDYVRRIEVRERDRTRTYIAVDSPPGLVYLVQVGTLEFHVWGSRTDRLDRPDRMVFDLDPDPEVEWPQVVEAARHLHRLLDDLGLRSYVKTSGGNGLHVVVPLVRRHGWDDVKAFSRAVVQRMVRQAPDRYTARVAKARRRGKVYLDYLRNSRGATAVATFSTRAAPGAPVSTPLAWDELAASSGSRQFTIRTLPARLRELDRDTWSGFDSVRQSITRRMQQQLDAAG